MRQSSFFKRLLLLVLILNASLLCFGRNEPIVEVAHGEAVFNVYNTLIVTIGGILGVSIPKLISLHYRAKYKVKDED